MNAIRTLVRDLFEKRLWPVALALVVAAVAVPLLIGGGRSASAVPDPAIVLAAAPPSAPASPVVELVGPPSVRSRPGSVRDPFRRSKANSATRAGVKAGSSGSGGAASAGSGGATSGGAESGGAKSGSGSSHQPAATTKPKLTPTIGPSVALAARSTYQTMVRFTRSDGRRWVRPLARLAVLGAVATPVLQYLGVGTGGEYAIFLLAPTATAVGADGACVVADPCRAIGLRKGDRLGIDLPGRGSTVRHFFIEVIRVRRFAMPSVERAQAWRKRVAPNGPAMLRGLAKDAPTAAALDELHYATSTGTIGLTRAP
jgi:hypothetical protein